MAKKVRRLRKIIDHLKKPLLVGILIILLLSSFIADYKPTEAATYTWTQASWADGTSATAATHDANRDGQTAWTYYSSASSTISASTNLTLSTTASSTTQTTDADFNLGTTSQTTVASNSVALATSFSCGSGLAVTHAAGAVAPVNKTVTYGTVASTLGGTGNKCWITQNLGATNQATAVDDGTEASAGWYWQFNRKQGYKHDGTTLTPAWTITAIDEASDWTSANDPCALLLGVGWRIPTRAEWTNADSTGAWNVWTGPWGSALKLHAAGILGSSDGALTNRGVRGYYWSSTQYETTNSWHLYFHSGDSYVNNTGYKAYGFSVRCLNDNTATTYSSSGTFTSSIIDTTLTNGVASWGTMTWNATLGGQTATTTARSCNTSNCSDGPAWSNCSNITSGNDLSTGGCVTNGHRYLQYRVGLATSDTSVSPTFDDATFTWNYYDSTNVLTSSKYDSSSDANVIGGIKWDEDATLPSGTTVTVSLRTASSAANLDSSSWTNFTNACGKISSTVTCDTNAIPSAMKDGTGDQWVQYKTTLTSTGANKPAVDNVILTYVVNARPEFDVPNTTASQISDSADANWGKVQIDYDILDSDTTTGTVNPGYVTPSFEYNIGGGWTAITSGYLNSGATDNKSIQEGSYTSYTAYWDAKSQIPSSYTTSGQIRITINDNEGANNSTTTTISNITIDTTSPTLSTFTLNASVSTTTVAITDDSNILYNISNNSDSSSDGSNGISGSWQAVGSTSTSTNLVWTYSADSDGYKSVTIAYRDVYGNTSTTTDVAPYTPANFYYKDICNTAIDDWREFLSWGQYTATTSAAFGSYKVYRSTDGTTYSLLVTNTPYTLNYHVDTTVASTTTYYYKMVTVDSDGDTSSYTTAVSDLPDGQGGSDSTAPTLTSVTVADYGATWATITWTSDEVANSIVNYGTTVSYGTTETVDTMNTSHSVTITGLTPNTQYHYRAKSQDVMENEGASADATFTTSGGPTISNVTVAEITDSTATITWNTNESANSYVYYSVYSNMSSASSDGSATLVATSTGGIYQHNVTLSGLTQNTRYYYYVQSTDSDSNTVTDKYDSNTGAYRDFRTTADSRAPVISNVTVAVRSSSALVITWNTDESANTQLYYGATSAYGSNSTLDSTFSRNHVAAISSGLTESTTYHFQARSTDAAGNLATSTDQETSTTAANEVITVYVGGGGLVSPTITDTTAPSISNIKVSDIGAFNATVSFDTSEEALGLINYGKDTSYGNTAGSDNYKSSHQIKLSGLKLGTEYHFRVKAADKNGNIGESSDNTFTTLYAAEVLEDLVTLENAEQFQEQLESLLESVMPSLVPPFVSNVKIDEITEDSALITWKTNVPAHGSLFFSEDSKYEEGKYTTEIAENKGKIKDHELKITDLISSTKYHVQAKSYVFPDATGKSKDYTFFTKSAKTTPEIINVGNTEFTVAWRTSKETSSFVQYTNTATGQKGQTGTEDRTNQHVIRAENLIPDTLYEVRVYGYDADNNLVEADPLTVRTKKDVVPPKISSININSAFVPYKQDQLQTVVSWKTDEPANSVVYFEEGVGVSTDLKNKAGQLDEYVLDHSVIITNFKPATIYRIKISSSDEANNITVGPMRTILAPRASESVLEIITKNLEEAFGFLKNIGQ